MTDDQRSLDERYMHMALDEARLANSRGDFPVGAVLVIGESLIDGSGNATSTRQQRGAHAETLLLLEYGVPLRNAEKRDPTTIYATLEPCMMCAGAIVNHRVSRVVYACPDPSGGFMHKDAPQRVIRAPFYEERWPEVVSGVLRDESYELLVAFMERTSGWDNTLRRLREERERW